jgi:signal transduction histidine kinase/CheY-like chemotaxis protein
MSPGVLNPASVSALLGTVASLIGGMGAWLLGHAPDWEDVKPLAWVGFTAAVTAACSFTATLDVPAAAHAWTSRVQVLAIALHVAAWYAYFAHWGARRSPARRWAIVAPLLAVGALALVPGLVRGDAVALRPVAWLGLVYHDPAVTASGCVAYAVLAAYGVAGVARVALLGRARLPFPVTHLATVVALVAMGIHDFVVVVLSAPTPSLLDFALYGPAIVIAAFTLRRVVQTAADLRRLRAGLEVAVVERTGALQRTQAALADAERLAVLGRYSAGIAGEVHERAAGAARCLDELSRELGAGPLRSGMQGARTALARIAALARQLAAAGRATGSGPSRRIEVRMRPAVDAAIAAARAGAGEDVVLEVTIPPGLTVLGDDEAFGHVLAILVMNGIDAIPRGRRGAVRVRAEAAGARVRLVVEDDGDALSDEALLRAREPHGAAVAAADGPGLGLAVARRLAESMGGVLRVERAPGGGTRTILELAQGAPDASEADLPPALAAVPRRSRVLVVDDDLATLRALVSLLSGEHEVSAARGAAEALAELAERSFDLVLCEATLATGGAERFWQELLVRAPQMQGRVAFLVGGDATGPARAFLDRQPQPVLEKPFGTGDVREVMERLGISRRGEAPAAPVRAPKDVVGRMRPT